MSKGTKTLPQITSTTLFGQIEIVLTIICLGILYVCQRYANISGSLGPLTFIAFLLIFATMFMAVLSPFAIMLYPEIAAPVYAALDIGNRESKQYWYDLAFWGTMVGITIAGGMVFVQLGTMTVSAGKTSFIVGMYVIIVPFGESFLSNTKISIRTWIATVVSCIGMFILSGCTESKFLTSDLQIGILYDILALLFVAAQVMVTGRGSNAVGGTFPILVSSYVVSTVLCIAIALIFESEYWVYPYTGVNELMWVEVVGGLVQLLAGLFLTAALSILDPTQAAILSSPESLAGAVFGYFILREIMSPIELFGGFLMVSAVLIEVWPAKYCFGYRDTVQNESVESEEEALASSLIDSSY